MELVRQQLKDVHERLTDFQKATVEVIMSRYGSDRERRVLVADEVGLGKTIVAKGVIARLLGQALAQKKGVLRVTYICSNLALAQENRSKLAIFPGNISKNYVRDPSFSRLAELGVNPGGIDKGEILEVCSLTPGTSFNLTQGHGNKRERYIIYRALAKQAELAHITKDLSEFFRYEVSSWESERVWFNARGGHVQSVLDDFSKRIQQPVTLSAGDCASLDLENPTWITLLSTLVARLNTKMNNKGLSLLSYRVRSHLRVLFVQCCASNLSADLFILDEFQRFKELLNTNGETEQGLIAKEVFQKQDSSKVLLLSATPYKAISKLSDDETQDAHLDELRKLLDFLANGDPSRLEKYEKLREELLSQLLRLMDRSVAVEHLDHKPKDGVESVLRPLICRTERAQVSESFDTVMATSHTICDETFSRSDIEAFIAMDQLGQQLGKLTAGRHGNQLLEFYKTAPWALSFLSGYQLWNQLEKYLKTEELQKSLKLSKAAWLPYERIDRYQLDIEHDAPNAKIRLLSKVVFGSKGERLLWIPSSMSYYPNQGAFEKQEGFTKTLLFSAFVLAPRALSGILSYQAEKRLIPKGKGRRPKYFGRSNAEEESRKRISPIIRFDGRASLAPWALIYPCQILMAMKMEPGNVSLGELVSERKEILERRLVTLRVYVDASEKKTDNWYALAPFLLDRENGNKLQMDTWLSSQIQQLKDHSKHVGRYKQLLVLNDLLRSQDLKLGPMPDDLAEFLAMLSLAGPGVCASRSWLKLWPASNDNTRKDTIKYATQGAMALVQMFNKPEAQRVLKTIFMGEKQHWRSVLEYCADGNVQAMLDEYGHLLKSAGNDASSAIEKLEGALGITTSSVTAQLDQGKKSSVSLQKVSLSCHYAVPLGNQKMTDEKGIIRVGHIRDAFNSPFRPFVLSSTSIGQEGLDFHWYCSRVVHWNLPQNPIDLEQREGRINRYKSLTVRRRVAEQYRNVLNGEITEDLWDQLFSIADVDTKATRKSDLIPYWHMPEGTAKLERLVPMLPMSKEPQRLDEILRILSLYRLAFGQPRQQELLENLLHREMSVAEIELIKRKLVIDLAPINYINLTES
ncbi:MAG: helicase-related protein [Desulfocapsaceae bacterium]|nr:helicase-related protein [Desulfocapsaceae bacterium]